MPTSITVSSSGLPLLGSWSYRSLISSILLASLGSSQSLLSEKAIQLANSVDFQEVLMNFMLSFLLFAGAIHIDAAKLKQERLPVIVLATVFLSAWQLI
ncbi:MAG: hypothetical protein H7069_14845 [Phormidesmis sp. FL-bin-119]|nr:hypothetical protein [Pedobacter sp.]